MHPSPPAKRQTIGRRSLLVATSGVAAPFVPRLARAAEITWRLAHNAPTDFALNRRLLEAANSIAEQSGGRMTLEVHPDNELGSPVGLLGQLRAGTLDAAPLGSQILANDLGVAVLPMTGFAFDGYDQLWSAMDAGTGAFLRARIRDRLGLFAMDRCWDFGFRQITTTTKPITAAADMRGLKLRTAPEADFIALFQALKALPMAMPLGAMVPALTAHSIDGQEGVLPLISAAGLDTLQTHCALSNHIWDGQWLCISGTSWSRLPASLKDMVASVLNESAVSQRKDIAGADVTIRNTLTAQGMAFNPIDLSSFRAVLRQSGYYAALKSKVGDDAWAALEQYTGRLT